MPMSHSLSKNPKDYNKKIVLVKMSIIIWNHSNDILIRLKILEKKKILGSIGILFK